MSLGSLNLVTLLFLFNQLFNVRTGGTEFRLCHELSGTQTIDRIGILSSRTLAEYCLYNKIRLPYFLHKPKKTLLCTLYDKRFLLCYFDQFI